MSNLSISIFGNKILPEIINEIKLLSKFKFKFYDNIDLFEKQTTYQNQLFIFFITKDNKKVFEKMEINNFPLIIVSKFSISSKISSEEFVEKINMPFSILDLERKIISLSARYNFKKSSLINLKDYTINKNERKIKKDNIELQLTEKEINFLILFSKNNKPLSKNFVLKNVWNYSSQSDTHTVETHIHRLRKKFLDKFGDNNFIKNNNKGYYI